MVTVGKHLILARQEGTPRVHQVDAGQVIFGRDGLCSQVFLDGDGVVGAAFYRGVVGDHHTGLSFDLSDSADEAAARYLVII